MISCANFSNRKNNVDIAAAAVVVVRALDFRRFFFSLAHCARLLYLSHSHFGLREQTSERAGNSNAERDSCVHSR